MTRTFLRLSPIDAPTATVYPENEGEKFGLTAPVDAFHVWEFAALCRDGNTLTNGKFPDADGCVPEDGAYYYSVKFPSAIDGTPWASRICSH